MDFWHPIQFIRTFFILYKFIEFLPPSLNPLKLFSFISASNNVRYIPEHFFSRQSNAYAYYVVCLEHNLKRNMCVNVPVFCAGWEGEAYEVEARQGW